MADGGVEELCARLDDGRSSVACRMRTLFGLKELARRPSEQEAVDEVELRAVAGIAGAMRRDASELVRHEAAYVLGQTENPGAVSYLEEALADEAEDPMVRHEAAEALGAIATTECAKILGRFEDDPQQVVRETVAVAQRRIGEVQQDPEARSKHKIYQSVDPAPASAESHSLEELRTTLLDENLPIYDRYVAMFSLRNLANTEPRAVEALCEAFGDSSALFRHELAYVLGQVQAPSSIPALRDVLLNSDEQPMVRHEAAEALGSIGTSDCEELLAKFLKDEAAVVRESCEVALDITTYNTSDSLHYADTLVK